jgi:uncharacterized membrane protein HdeD (DUF308 family)
MTTQQTTVARRHENGQRWWLLTLRGGAIGGIGILLLLMVLDIRPVPMGYALGGLLLIAGSCAGCFGWVNQRIGQDGLWLMLNGLIDIGFGVAALVLSHNPVETMIDLIGFWALLFAFLQSVQSIYVYIGLQYGPDPTVKILHILLVGASGGLAFTVLMRPEPPADPVLLTGLLPMLMGGLLIALGSRVHADHDQATATGY